MYMWTAQQTQMETHSFFLAADDGSVQNNKGHEKETQTKSTVLQKEDGNTRDHYQNKTGGGKLQTKTSMCYDNDKSQHKTLIFRYQKTY